MPFQRKNHPKCAISSHFGTVFLVSSQIIAWGDAEETLEGTCKRRLVIVAATFGYVEYRHVGSGVQQVARLLHANVGDVALWGIGAGAIPARRPPPTA